MHLGVQEKGSNIMKEDALVGKVRDPPYRIDDILLLFLIHQAAEIAIDCSKLYSMLFLWSLRFYMWHDAWSYKILLEGIVPYQMSTRGEGGRRASPQYRKIFTKSDLVSVLCYSVRPVNQIPDFSRCIFSSLTCLTRRTKTLLLTSGRHGASRWPTSLEHLVARSGVCCQDVEVFDKSGRIASGWEVSDITPWRNRPSCWRSLYEDYQSWLDHLRGIGSWHSSQEGQRYASHWGTACVQHGRVNYCGLHHSFPEIVLSHSVV